MKIAINGNPLYNVSGIGSYTKNLINAISLVDRENSYFLLISESGNLPVAAPADFRVCRIKIPFFKTQLGVPLEIFKKKIDVYHGQNYLPFFKPCRLVVTIHDLSFEVYPEFYPRKSLVHYRALLPPSLGRADRVIAISTNTKEDLVNRYGIKPEKINVIYEAASDIFAPRRDEAILSKYGVKPPYILHVGNITLLRNLRRTLQAFAKLKMERNIPHTFVIAGAKSWPYEDVELFAGELGIKDAVKVTGYLPEADLPAIYALSDLFVRVSLYEGFGIPLLEAMKCGAPIVASNIASIPEVVGDAAVLVDPNSVEDIKNGLYKVLSSETLRSFLREKGFRRASEFSWRKSALQTIEVYKEALGR